ncbi:MAG: tetratricopeptide repeat protein [Coprococcus sp.]
MKKLLTGFWIILVLFLACLIINFVANELMIDRYNSGIYEKKSLAVLGFTEPYIAPYNQGNNYFKMGDYEKAVEEYKKALSKNPPHDRECMIRINLALAMVTPIKPEEITENNLEEIINILEEAKEILIAHGCANRDDHNGHNEDAQRLKDEIDEFEESLKEKSEPDDGDDKDTDEKKDDNNDENSGDKEKKRKELEDLEEQGTKDRNQEIDEYQYYFSDYEYYDGPTW